ncbi:nuclear transport factor 2 family protein [Nocardia sp. NPDC004068]|uniref:nuclear transport factor 2 family protein n=1 Tax=Nocardia sp. NPDC004068 TaxID=3364303 RepID=UPI003697653A
MSTERSLEDKIRWVIDVEEIKMLMSKYCQGIDKHDEEMFMSIWADDAVYVLPRGEGKGIEGVRELVRKVWQQVPRCHHHITNPVIEFDGDTATARTDVTYYRLTSDGIHQLLSGGYDFVFARIDGGWRIRRMEFASFVSLSPIFKENVLG